MMRWWSRRPIAAASFTTEGVLNHMNFHEVMVP